MFANLCKSQKPAWCFGLYGEEKVNKNNTNNSSSHLIKNNAPLLIRQKAWTNNSVPTCGGNRDRQLRGRIATTLIAVLKTSHFVKLDRNTRNTKQVENFVLNTGLADSNGGGARASGTICCTARVSQVFTPRAFCKDVHAERSLPPVYFALATTHYSRTSTDLAFDARYSATLAKVREKNLQKFVLLSNVNRNVAKATQASHCTYRINVTLRSVCVF
jgi:hypothetical protein